VANRIDQKFSELSSNGSKGLFPFLVAGQPDLKTTQELIKRLEKLGVAGIELGFPFTDPIADGPVIQNAFTHALSNGITVAAIMQAIGEIRSQVSIPIIAMVSATIVYRIGIDNFLAQAARAGFDGFIIPDLSLEEAPAISEKIKKLDLRMVLLVSPTSPENRQQLIAKTATGFIYYMSIAGITGERDKLPEELPANVAHLKKLSGIPVLVGFGIKTPEHVRQVCNVADGAIVGSAIVRRITQSIEQGAEHAQMLSSVEDYVRELLTGLPKK
jgi:tryptophan synthase alpha chain